MISLNGFMHMSPTPLSSKSYTKSAAQLQPAPSNERTLINVFIRLKDVMKLLKYENTNSFFFYLIGNRFQVHESQRWSWKNMTYIVFSQHSPVHRVPLDVFRCAWLQMFHRYFFSKILSFSLHYRQHKFFFSYMLIISLYANQRLESLITSTNS